jgi:RNA polymerase primary sigma factor
MRQLTISKSITNRDIGSLDIYLNDISREGMITPEEEIELTQKIRQNDTAALEKLVKANLRFVVSAAKQYQHRGLTLPDLINEGNIGLIKAAQRFDETRGFKFISYAVWWIRQSILQAISEQSRLIRLPLNQITTVNRIFKASSLLEQKLERIPSMSEIADFVDLPEEKVKETFRISSKHISLDAPISEEDNLSMLDIIVPVNSAQTDQILIHESLSMEIQRSLSLLSVKEKEIVNMFFGIGYKQPQTYDEIAIHFNLTTERVRQIKEKAIKTLRMNKRSRFLKNYLE